MKIKCEYCRSYQSKEKKNCTNCGAPVPMDKFNNQWFDELQLRLYPAVYSCYSVIGSVPR